MSCRKYTSLLEVICIFGFFDISPATCTMSSQLGTYTCIDRLEENATSIIWDVEAIDGKAYIGKVFRRIEPGSHAGRQFGKIFRLLKQLAHPRINQVIDLGESDEGQHYLILDKIAGSTLEKWAEEQMVDFDRKRLLTCLRNWVSLLEALDQAAAKKLYHRDLHPRNIMMNEQHEAILIDFGIASLVQSLSTEVAVNQYSSTYAPPEVVIKNEASNKRLTDQYSLALCMLYALIGAKLFEESDNIDRRLEAFERTYGELGKLEGLLAVFRRCLAHDPQKRYARYSELTTELEESIKSLLFVPEKTIAIETVSGLSIEDMEALLRDSQEQSLKVSVDDKLGKEGDITFRMASPNFFIRKGFLDKAGKQIRVHQLKRIDNLTDGETKQWKHVWENGELLPGPLSSSMEANERFDVTTLFEQYFLSAKSQAPTYQLKRAQKDILRDYRRLLEAEIDHIQKHAFQATYTRKERIQQNEIAFFLKLEGDKADKPWIFVHDFIEKSKESRRKDQSVELTLEGYQQNARGEEQGIGVPVNFDAKEGKLVVRDFVGDYESIPENGKLQESIKLQIVQYERQKRALADFEKGLIVNPDLRAYLFHASNLPDNDYLIEERVKPLGGKSLESAQEEAVQKVLFRPPITLIQGPPGTGKTTVITEMILQILRKDPQARILVTSQTHVAVDNVLEKLLDRESVRMVRLGKSDRIAHAQIKQKTFDQAAQNWAKDAQKKSERHFKQQYSDVGEMNPILKHCSETLQKGLNWDDTQSRLAKILEYGKKANADLIKALDSREAFEKVLMAKIPSKQQQNRVLGGLHQRWIKLLQQAKRNDSLQQKLIGSLNVIGSTCNHIASSKYRNYSFEFDYVIMDEAAKATPAESLVPLNMGRNLVLVGDHKQLPPLVTATDEVKKSLDASYREEQDLDFDQVYYNKPSLFQKMYEEAPEAYKEMLDTQFRMPDALGKIISRNVYEDRLRSHKEAGTALPFKPKAGLPVCMLDISKQEDHQHKVNGHSPYNPCSARLIIELLKRLDQQAGIATCSIAVITGYRQQAAQITAELRQQSFEHVRWDEQGAGNLTVSTVDRFQGAERQIVIFDIVRSEGGTGGSLGFLTNLNRINVALTRTQSWLILVGNASFVRYARGIDEDGETKPSLIQQVVQQFHAQGLIYQQPEDLI